MPLEIIRSDITTLKVDAIVNAANRSLRGGGGVDGAIHRAAGPGLDAECRDLGGCETGEAKITGGYNLPAKYVIHTVGPIWHGGSEGEEQLLASCYRNSLELARAYHCETVAFPMISTGVYRYPKDQALAVAVDTVGRFLLENDMTVYLVVFGRDSFQISQKLFADVQAYIDDHYVDEHADAKSEELNRRTLWEHSVSEAMELEQRLAEMERQRQARKKREWASSAAPNEEEKDGSRKTLSKIFSRKVKKSGDAQPMYSSLRESGLSTPGVSSVPSMQPDWDSMIRQTDEGFTAMLLRKIDEKGLTDAQCYKKANVDRRLFSKIRSNPDYRPSKATVFAFAVALELSLEETLEMLEKAGFALSHSSKFDIILEYCILNRFFNVLEINEVLFKYDLPLLGCVPMGL